MPTATNRRAMNASRIRQVADGAILVLMAGMVAAFMTYALDRTRVPTYRSIARVLVTPNPQLFQGRDLLAGLETLERTAIHATYEHVFNSRHIQAAAFSVVPFAAGYPRDYTVETLALPSTDVLEVTSEGPSPAATAHLANEVVWHGITYLQARYPMYTIEVLDEAVPAAEPFAPAVVRNGLIAFFAGAALGLGIVVAVHRLATPRSSPTVEDPSELLVRDAAPRTGSTQAFDLDA